MFPDEIVATTKSGTSYTLRRVEGFFASYMGDICGLDLDEAQLQELKRSGRTSSKMDRRHKGQSWKDAQRDIPVTVTLPRGEGHN